MNEMTFVLQSPIIIDLSHDRDRRLLEESYSQEVTKKCLGKVPSLQNVPP